MAALHAVSFETPRPWSAEEFTSLLADPMIFIVTLPAGFALGRVILDEVELLTLAVDPDQRRAGHGRALLAAFEASAVAQSAKQVFLEVSAENRAARALYVACGYAETGRRQGYYRAPEGRRIDAVLMARTLV